MSTDLESSVVPVNPVMILDRLSQNPSIDPDKLGKVIDLVTAWNSGQSIKAFNRDMNGCQGELAKEEVPQDGWNDFTKSHYPKLEGVQTIAVPVYTKHGFSLSWSEGPVAADGLHEIIMTVRHTEGHVEIHRGHYPIDGQGAKGGSNMNALQGTVSAHTYAMRDMMRQLFNIRVKGLDADGNDITPLSDDQVAKLNDLLDRCYKEIPGYDSQGFWDWIHKEKGTKKRMHELSAAFFDEAVLGLNNKLRQGAKK